MPLWLPSARTAGNRLKIGPACRAPHHQMPNQLQTKYPLRDRISCCGFWPRCYASGLQKENTPYALACGGFAGFTLGAVRGRTDLAPCFRCTSWAVCEYAPSAGRANAMSHVQHSVRLPRALDRALRQAAQNRQVSPYALLQHCVRTGIASLSSDHAASQISAELTQEIGMISARLAHIERLVERDLYVACAAYTYARAAAGSRDEVKLTSDINAAFARQLAAAGEL